MAATNYSTQRRTRRRQRAPHVWNLVTNQQNMLYMLAAGLVMDPDGFGGKHYTDMLDLDPGWVPLCRDTTPLPVATVEQSVSEQKFLVPCVASFDLQGFSGPVRIVPRSGKERSSQALPPRKGKSDFLVLVPTPLPLSLLRQITFRSQADHDAFETAAADVANVDLRGVTLRVDGARFAGDAETQLPAPSRQREMQVELTSVTSGRTTDAQAIGGALAMLYHASNRSDFGVALYQSVIDKFAESDGHDTATNPFFDGLPVWLRGGDLPTSADIAAQIYWRIVGALIDGRRNASGKAPTDVVLEQLEHEAERAADGKDRRRITKLADALRDCVGLGGGTITELFERQTGPLSRSLLLFCLREHCVDLLEFSHPSLEDAEFAAAAVLFGVRDGWIQMPRELRSPELSAFVSSWMAATSHAGSTGFDALDAPIPLRGRFIAVDGQWTTKQAAGALNFARDHEWVDCIQTRITLEPGDYPREFQRDGLQVVVPGEAKANAEVDRARFMERIGQWPMTASSRTDTADAP